MAIPIRQALAIGNNAYPGGRIQPLESCINDAMDVSNCLRSIGFQVHTGLDRDYYSMQVITQRFIRSIQPGAIVFFYFSGHGIQYDGYNFLIPIGDTEIDNDNIKATSMSAEKLIQDMHSRSPRVVIVILDSCRSYWGTRSLLRTVRADGAWPGIRPGLAPMRVPPATIVAYACAAETTSSQFSMNGRNSLYTYHLLRYITTPNVDIDQVLRNVAYEVQKDPLNELKQVPYRYSSCNEYICLVFCPEMNVPAWPGVMQPGADFSPFKKPYPKRHSDRHFRPPINYHQNRMNYQFYKPRHHHSAYMYAPSKAMRYPTGLGYPLMRPIYYRRR